MAPDAMHHARWMTKAIYAQKIWLFQKHFGIIASKERALHSICIFIIVVYLKEWFTAPFAAPLLAMTYSCCNVLVSVKETMQPSPVLHARNLMTTYGN